MAIDRLWVAELHVSDATRQKVQQVHGLDAFEIRRALVCVPGLSYTWHDHPIRGRRALVTTYVGSKRVLCVLYPRPHPLGDNYSLGSAYVI